MSEKATSAGMSRAGQAAIACAGILISLILLGEFKELIGPMFLALNLMITAYPIHTWLVRKGTPSWLSAVIVALVVFAVLLAMIAGMVWSVSETIDIFMQYSGEISYYYSQILLITGNLGLDVDTVRSLISTIDPQSVLGAATSLLSGASGFVGMLGVVIMAILFMTMDTPDFARRIRRVDAERPSMSASLIAFAQGIRRYWLVTTLFGLIVAVLDGLALVILDVPLALVWALFSFLTNYIPNVGLIIGLIPPAIVALFTHGWEVALIVMLVYLMLNAVIQGIIQPRVAGEAVGVTPTVSFFSLLLWTSVIGALGSLLSLPLTLLVKTFFIDSDPNLKWLNNIIAMDPHSKKTS